MVDCIVGKYISVVNLIASYFFLIALYKNRTPEASSSWQLLKIYVDNFTKRKVLKWAGSIWILSNILIEKDRRASQMSELYSVNDSVLITEGVRNEL